MSKLRPPLIEGKIPAFAGQSLKVPLIMNSSVSPNQVLGMSGIIKTIQTSVQKAILQGVLNYDSINNQYYAIFDIQGVDLNIGQYYKVQIAYIDQTKETGYYSSIGIVKYTSLPGVTISGLTDNLQAAQEYTGIYTQESLYDNTTLITKRDETEKIYSYCFELTDKDNNLIETSGWQIHNSAEDTIRYTSSDTWSVTKELEYNVPHYLTYKIKTMNGLEAQSPRYFIINQESIDIEQDYRLINKINFEEGCVELSFCPFDKYNEKIETIVNGNFVLLRSSDLDDFRSWDKLYSFSYLNSYLQFNKPIKLFDDCTVQQGVKYKYALQAYNQYGLYSNKLYGIQDLYDSTSSSISVDFEDAFLFDGKRQLKIRFNPKVSSFKNTILETKIDTLGGQYPFIFRNGNVRYKEFPISGLISFLMDNNEKFFEGIQKENNLLTRQRTRSEDIQFGELDTVLSENNMHRERIFKLEVLNWLTNGEPKLFRSPAEGNYIVRLMNTSLTPNDTLSRMIHTFNCTAYEIADFNFKNLVKLNIIPEINVQNFTSLKYGQIIPRVLKDPNGFVNKIQSEFNPKNEPLKESVVDLNEFKYSGFSLVEMSDEENSIKSMLLTPAIYSVKITEATPGTRIAFNFTDGLQGLVPIEIGGTGTYFIQTENNPIKSINLMAGDWDNMQISFSYQDNILPSSFNKVVNLNLNDEIRQFIGIGFNVNIMDSLNDIKREVQNVYYLKIEKRQVQEIWSSNGKYYRNQYKTDEIKDDEWDPTVIYHQSGTTKYHYNGSKEYVTIAPDYRLLLEKNNEQEYIDFTGREYTPRDPEDPPSPFRDTFGRMDALYEVGAISKLKIGSGLIVDMAYRVKTKEYNAEYTDVFVIEKKEEWLVAKNSMTDSSSLSEIKKQINNVETKYSFFIGALSNAI